MKYFYLIIALASFNSSAAIISAPLNIEGERYEAFSEEQLTLPSISTEYFDGMIEQVKLSFYVDLEKSKISSPLSLRFRLFSDVISTITIYSGTSHYVTEVVEFGGFKYFIEDLMWNKYPFSFRLESDDFNSGDYLVFSTGTITATDTLGEIPEPETFALFLMGAVGLCVRRQIKANATLPV